MDAAKMKEVLKREYGINNEKEFNMAVSKMGGINLGIFTMPLAEMEASEDEQAKKTIAIA